MSSSFDKYYYDNLGETTLEDNKSKMQIANEAVNILIDRLEPEDRFGMVLFDDRAYLAKPMNLVSKTDMEVVPVTYLSSNIKITSGSGTKELPYVLSL